ncbi:hypothetical protein P152DRAFT_202224 [Eremomyces bilateralis CBS 781.70]|uniref:Uncharacterized protein n=1 Tax=Eremomyces bilateralis CBS 781.70 TaxID=1392243 RepID=A0A6G1GD29_9PEZI|nr:uncharacterized protein P152DRAFT_202224 [Eremomyces bilateralis CBS 781.70]KAF1815933.1 hypothetical protein P152DRAFT_202224 [Eremomyces bilateralis CBS 781.70]
MYSRKRGRSSSPPLPESLPEKESDTQKPSIYDTIKRSRAVPEHDGPPLMQLSDCPRLPIQPLLASRLLQQAPLTKGIASDTVPRSDTSPIVLAVVESTRIHVDLLHRHLDALASLHPDLCFYVVLRDSHPLLESIASSLTCSPFPMPTLIVQPRTVVPLGLLHPLGGGQTLLDAVVLLDSSLRKRITLPVGWGEGSLLTSPVPGDESARFLGVRMMEILSAGLHQLQAEQ